MTKASSPEVEEQATEEEDWEAAEKEEEKAKKVEVQVERLSNPNPNAQHTRLSMGPFSTDKRRCRWNASRAVGIVPPLQICHPS